MVFISCFVFVLVQLSLTGTHRGAILVPANRSRQARELRTALGSPKIRKGGIHNGHSQRHAAIQRI